MKDTIITLLSYPAVRVAIVSLVVSILVNVIKKYSATLQQNKTLVRLVSVAAVAIVTLASDWSLDGEVKFEVWLVYFLSSITGVELSYQWLIKWIDELAASRKEARRVGEIE